MCTERSGTVPEGGHVPGGAGACFGPRHKTQRSLPRSKGAGCPTPRPPPRTPAPGNTARQRELGALILRRLRYLQCALRRANLGNYRATGAIVAFVNCTFEWGSQRFEYCASPLSPFDLQGGINGQVAVSALGSSCACPTAFITFCPSWRLQRIQFHRHVQPAPSPNGWGCDLQDSIWLGVHPGQWSLLHQVLLLAGSHLALPGSGWLSVLRLKNPVGTGCRFGVNAIHTTYSKGRGLPQHMAPSIGRKPR